MSTTIRVLYEDNHDWLCQWLRRRLDCSEEALDLAQDTFLRLLRKPDDVPGIKEPRAFLTTVANTATDEHHVVMFASVTSPLRAKPHTQAVCSRSQQRHASHKKDLWAKVAPLHSRFCVFMSLSGQQQRLVRLLKNGFHLRIVRSVLNQSPVYCELVSASVHGAVEVIPMWRIYKMLATGVVCLDTGEIATARAIVLTRP